MKLHYMGTYHLDPASLPHGEHMPGAVPFKEAENSGSLALIANGVCIALIVILAIPAWMRCRAYIPSWQLPAGAVFSLLILFPHELLHAVCYKKDVYLYTCLKQGLLFVTGPETMSKGRFIFMCLFPNLVFGCVPYVLGMVFPHLVFCAVLGTLAIAEGAGDYYNVYNALTQMPKGARTYLYGFHSWWYMP